ncbi:MAG: GNAT family N-acetyltransferase [Desulfobacterales bacterium]
MRIRKAIEKDASAISLLARQTFTETYDDLTDKKVDRYVSEFFSIRQIRKYLNSPTYRILVADNGQLAGYILLGNTLAPEFLQDDNPIECIRLFVVKDAQGQRFGSMLLESALNICAEEGNDVLWLKV